MSGDTLCNNRHSGLELAADWGKKIIVYNNEKKENKNNSISHKSSKCLFGVRRSEKRKKNYVKSGKKKTNEREDYTEETRGRVYKKVTNLARSIVKDTWVSLWGRNSRRNTDNLEILVCVFKDFNIESEKQKSTTGVFHSAVWQVLFDSFSPGKTKKKNKTKHEFLYGRISFETSSS